MFAGSLSDGRIQLFQPKSGTLWTCWKVTADPNSGWTSWSPFPIPIDCNGVGNGGAAALANNITVIFVPNYFPGAPQLDGYVGGPSLSFSQKLTADSHSGWSLFGRPGGPDPAYSPPTDGEAPVAGIRYVTAAVRADDRIQVFYEYYEATVQTMNLGVGWWNSDNLVSSTQMSADPDIRNEWPALADYSLGNPPIENQPTVVSLPDGRLQIFTPDDLGEVFTYWMTDPEGSHWTGEAMRPPTGPNPPIGPPSLAATRRADRRAQLWAAWSEVTANEGTYTRWKASQDPSAPWTDWELFSKPLPGGTKDLVVAPLSDGRLQLWFVMEDGSIYSSWETELTEEPNSYWNDVSPFQSPP
jgi:hypothetical protein